MKIKYIICSLALLIALSSCEKKQEKYEKRDVNIDTVFDSSSIESASIENTNSTEEDENNQENTSNIKENEQSNTNKRVLKAIDSINLRKSPTTGEDNYITEIPRDAQVNVYDEVSDENGDLWSKVEFDGSEGYVRSDLLTEIN